MTFELIQTRDTASQTVIVNATLGGTGAQTVNVFKVTGSVKILSQHAIIKRVGTLTNLTNMYATLYDGTNTVNLTADGATLSGLPVGTLFAKDKVAAEVYSVSDASQCRLLETLSDRFVGRPFIVTAKNGADTFIRFHYTTTDNPVDFDMEIHFEYELMNDSTLELA